MQRFNGIALAAALLFAAVGAAPSAAPSSIPSAAPTASPTPDPAIVSRAKNWYHMLQTGKIDRTQLTAEASTQISDAAIAGVAAKIAPLGEPVTFEQQRIATMQGSTVYVYLLTFGNGSKLNYIFALDAAGKVSGALLRPAQ